MAPYEFIEIAALVGLVACILCAAVAQLRDHALQALVAPPCFVTGGYLGIFFLLLSPPSGPMWTQSPVVTGIIIIATFIAGGLVLGLLAGAIAGRIQKLIVRLL